MNIHVLGTRGYIRPSARRHSRHSGVLIDAALLLDCGEKEFLAHEPKYILLTHLHPDHAFFVKTKEEAHPLPAPAFAPEPVPSFGVQELKHRRKLGAYEITPLTTIHSKLVSSQGYLIQGQYARILYTGDLVEMEEKHRAHLGAVDLVITEASFMRSGGLVRKYPDGTRSGHAGIPQIIETFAELTDRILLIHFGSWFYRDINAARKRLIELGTKHGIEVIVGYDGMKFEI